MSARYIGQRVIVYDAKGHYDCRGKIVGTHKIVGGDSIFDVDPDGDDGSMSKRICGIPACRLRSAGPVPIDPIHFKDYA